MDTTERGPARRLQLRQALVWLEAARGDSHAALLRGLDDDPRAHWRRLRERPLTRSATGDRVAARHASVSAAQSAPALRLAPLADLTRGPEDAPWSDAEAASPHHADQAWQRALSRAGEGPDLVAVARDAAVGTLAAVWGLGADAEQTLRTAVAGAAGALDAPFYAQSQARTREIAQAVALLRRLVPEGAAGGLAVAVAGASMATDLVTGAVALGLPPGGAPGPRNLWDQDPGRARRTVLETLRLAPPVRLEAATAETGCVLAGEEIEAGERVVSHLGAANRDPEVFTDPDRFDPDRSGDELAAVLVPGAAGAGALPFAVTCAARGLLALAALRPRPATGPLLRRSAAPVSPSLLACPVVTG
ncbi:cytochrome P450 [Streptomyces sp. NPDC005389]|uniref:cytochrome P450 n=1 Tax=Streptomyces sp. NPDC005389 TaxID=3157040 RepID=UPI0033A1C8B3